MEQPEGSQSVFKGFGPYYVDLASSMWLSRKGGLVKGPLVLWQIDNIA